MQKNTVLKFFITLAIVFFCNSLGVVHAHAASFSFHTSRAVVHQGEEIAVDVVLDPEGATINTISGSITIPNTLTFVDSDDSSSFLGFWVDQPQYLPDSKTFFFSGIIPGGFSGKIDPFLAKGKSAEGVMIRLVFRGKTPGAGALSFDSAHAYLNDTDGQEAPVTTRPLALVVDKLLGVALPILEDTEPPLAFTPILERDLLLYDGKYVVIFNTKDKKSGMDHYEIQEGDSPWEVVESPYLLKDQKISGDITIKAVDRAGNAQYAHISAPHAYVRFEIVVVIGLLIIIFLWYIVRRRPEDDTLKQ